MWQNETGLFLSQNFFAPVEIVFFGLWKTQNFAIQKHCMYGLLIGK
jgi:hypothetical protein